ncbi:MAG: stage II sporulation protein P [Eubacteriales bacterium]|nr:stage II sporulation protein P [Eubacteriales bacterium]
MDRRYRLYNFILLLLVVISFIFINNNKTISAFIKDTIISGCINMGMPYAACINSPENFKDSGILDEVLKEVMPVSKVINDSDYVAFSDDGWVEAIAVKEGNAVLAVQENESENMVSIENNTSNNEGINQSGNEISTGGQDNTRVSADYSDAISRNIITGTVYNKSDLMSYDFVHNNFYTITSITSLTSDILRPNEFINKDMSMKQDKSNPQILIFHTHSQEAFVDSVDGDASTTIVGVGDYLASLLEEKYGYKVIHDTSVYDYVDGKLDRSKAYTYAEEGVEKILNENPSIEVVIDLHRDGVAETTHLITEVDGKTMSKLMFFNGLSYSKVNGDIGYLRNPYRDDNLSMSLQMQLLGEAYYPGLLRNIYVNAYRYCLHKRGKSMLIEAGAQTNTVQEVKNAMEPLADMLDKLLKGEKVVNE